MNVKELKKSLPILFKSGVTPLIVGHRGIGKSQSIKQYTIENDLGFVDLRLGQMADAGDILGLPDIVHETKQTKFMQPSMLPTSGKGVLFLDELNRASKDVLQAVFQLVLDRKINEYELPKGWHVVCAQNPPTEDYDVNDFNDSAFADRFCQIKFEPTVKDWLEYARDTNTCGSIVEFIGQDNNFLEPELKDFNLDVKPSRRSWMAVNRIKGNCVDKTLFQELVMGMVGIEAAQSFFSFLANYSEVLKPEDVLNNFNKVKDQVERYSSEENNRQDILNNTCDGIIAIIKDLEKLDKKTEVNLANYIITIPKDLGHAFVNQLFDIPAFLCTETDSENGLSGGITPHSKKIISHFEGWKNEEIDSK